MFVRSSVLNIFYDGSKVGKLSIISEDGLLSFFDTG